MAKLVVVGEWAQVELVRDEEDLVLATCRQHRRRRCDWREVYDDLNDASEYAADHADSE